MSDFSFDKAATLVGAGSIEQSVLEHCLALAPNLVAADGAADRLQAMGYAPDLVIGDFDSLNDPQAWQTRLGDRARHLPDQNSSDMDKCLALIDAPVILAHGFTGGRLDHFLYALQAAAQSPHNIVLTDSDNCLFPLPAGAVTLDLPKGARLSLIPLWPVQCLLADGLQWPLAGQKWHPDGARSLSNRVVANPVVVEMADTGAVLITEHHQLKALYDCIIS